MLAALPTVRITADDYGAAPAINAAIEDLAERGAIDAVSIMVHGEACLGTIDRVRATGVATGIHLVLTQHRPLVPAAAAALLDRAGRYPRDHRRLFLRLAARPSLARALAAEATAQIERFLALGLDLGFLNSHEHVHMFPLLWPAVAELCERHDVGAVRSAAHQPIAPSMPGLVAAAARLSWRLRPLPARELFSPLGVGHAARLTLPIIGALLASPTATRPGPARPELVVHPSLDRARYGRAREDRQGEYHILRSGAVATLVREADKNI
jgi:predicted glycoside hydrolase/deacetylase ChbG (UPF0249 family)